MFRFSVLILTFCLAESAGAASAFVRTNLAPPFSEQQYQYICSHTPAELEQTLLQGFDQMRTFFGDIYAEMPKADRQRLVEIRNIAKAQRSVSLELRHEERKIWEQFKRNPKFRPSMVQLRLEKSVMSSLPLRIQDNTVFDSECETGEVSCSQPSGFRLDAYLTTWENWRQGSVRLYLTHGPENFESGLLEPYVVVNLPSGVAGVQMHSGNFFRIRGFVERVYGKGCGMNISNWKPQPQSLKYSVDPRTAL